MTNQSIEFSGFTCTACVKLVTLILKRLPGVSKVAVELNGKAQIESSRVLSSEEIAQALAETPYRVVKTSVNN